MKIPLLLDHFTDLLAEIHRGFAVTHDDKSSIVARKGADDGGHMQRVDIGACRRAQTAPADSGSAAGSLSRSAG